MNRRSASALFAGARAGAAAPLAIWVAFILAASPDAQAEALALEGQPAPGTGANFQTFDRPNLATGGIVAFTADTDADTMLDDVIYVDLELIAQENMPAPGIPNTPGVAFASFETFDTARHVNADGRVAFITTLRNVDPGMGRAIYTTDPKAGLVLVALESIGAYGISDRFFSDFEFAGIDDQNRVGFLAELDGDTDNDSVIYLDMTPLHREGDPVPASLGLAPGTIWDSDFDEIQWNAAGDVLFEGTTDLPADDMVLVYDPIDGEPVIVAQEGMAIDASGGTDELQLLLQSALADNGAWAFRGNLGLAPSDSDAIIIASTGFQAQQGDAVPELPGVVLGNFNGVSINALGDVLYLADLEGDTPAGVDEGLFVNGQMLITDGQPVAGLPEGAVLTDIGFEDAYINDDRQIVFAASYNDGDGPTEDGLFLMELDAAPGCPADLNGCGTVDVADLLVLLAAWGPCDDPDNCLADITDDGEVGIADLLELLAQWGPCPAGG